VSVDAYVRAGAIDTPDRDTDVSGIDVDAPFELPGPPGSPQLVLDLSTGTGIVTVEVDHDA
jgi:hypothetical protein